jgi:hypothetical protein
MAVTQKTPVPPAALSTAPPLAKLSREQVELEQMVERYLQGTLALRQKMELEGFCRDNPAYLDDIKLSTRINAGLRLIESAGKPEPWNETRVWFWQTHWFAGAAVAVVLALIVTASQFHSRSDYFAQRSAAAEKRLSELPLTPATTSRNIRVVPAGLGKSQGPAIVLGRATKAEFVTLQFDLAKSDYSHFDLEIERINQGRVAILRGMRRNSNGIVSWSINSSALGPGEYVVALSGLDWRGQAWPAGAVAFDVAVRRE